MKTITLEDLRPTVGTVHAAGVAIPVHPYVSWASRRSSLSTAAWPLRSSGRLKDGVRRSSRRIMTCDAVHDVIDAAIRWDAGSAAKAPFSAVEEARIIVAAVKASIPELEKLLAEGADLLELSSYAGEAQNLIERWRRHYNTFRPHSSLGYRPPPPEAVIPIDQRPTMH